jgi:hypothetical protein
LWTLNSFTIKYKYLFVEIISNQFKNVISGLRFGTAMLIGGIVHVNNKFVQKWDRSITYSVDVNNRTSGSVKENKAGYFDNVDGTVLLWVQRGGNCDWQLM